MDCEEQIGNESLNLIKQGAEARVFESTFAGRRSIVKERFSKKYRHPVLDSKLTLKRLNAVGFFFCITSLLVSLFEYRGKMDPLLHSLTLEYIEGVTVKDVFLEFGANGIVQERLDDVAAQIGEAIAKLHDGGLAHGDLTTSNMLVRSGTNQLVLIDFGLSFTSTLPEDKAVDLYVLERALLSMHSSCGNVMDRILTAYRKSSKQWSATFNKLAQDGTNVILEAVNEMRGIKKPKAGFQCSFGRQRWTRSLPGDVFFAKFFFYRINPNAKVINRCHFRSNLGYINLNIEITPALGRRCPGYRCVLAIKREGLLMKDTNELHPWTPWPHHHTQPKLPGRFV
ncbi:unnamed protein product [Thlaspi arvense]|uniref:non-specific serine/threonine protein kinase n=1 Tax=Thlaspi arvense TaxID=13288 RepID=A0AAU9RNJ2_THLAR|nr:unnamed protein product [Thlaspi arvense]